MDVKKCDSCGKIYVTYEKLEDDKYCIERTIDGATYNNYIDLCPFCKKQITLYLKEKMEETE